MLSPVVLSPMSPAATRAAGHVPLDSVRHACRAFEVEVAEFFMVPVSDIRSLTRRGPAAAVARQCAMYLVHTLLGQSHRAVGELFSRDRTTASHACRRIEDWRDDPMAEALLTALERRCAAVVAQSAVPAVRA